MLLTLLSKEEWKLCIVSCKICLSRPCKSTLEQNKVFLNFCLKVHKKMYRSVSMPSVGLGITNPYTPDTQKTL